MIPIYVITRNRWHEPKTWKFLGGACTLVISEDQRQMYEEHCPSASILSLPIVGELENLGAKINWILDRISREPGRVGFILDDDMESVWDRVEGRAIPPVEFMSLLPALADRAARAGARMFGFTHHGGEQPDVSPDRTIEHVVGVLEDGTRVDLRARNMWHLDYWLKQMKRYGQVLRDNRFMPVHNNPEWQPGMSLSQELAAGITDASYFADAYPGVCRKNELGWVVLQMSQ